MPNIDDFFEKLKEEEFRIKFSRRFSVLEEGDWEGWVRIAKEFGYEFTVEELVNKLPEGFYKGEGKKPDLGWDESTRPQKE